MAGALLGAPRHLSCVWERAHPTPQKDQHDVQSFSSSFLVTEFDSYFLCQRKRILKHSAASDIIRQKKSFSWASVNKNKYSCMKLLKI